MLLLFKSQNDSDYYRGTVKIRTKAMAYDRLNTILSSYTSQNNQTNPQVKESYRSYRNEDNYIYEVHAESALTAMLSLKLSDNY
ncbi:MAG: hypothetical protein R2847_11465 [Bacteroidia bacterium]